MPPFTATPPLSPRQRQLCDTIEKLTKARGGIPPTYVELAGEMRCHPSRIAQLVRSTAEKGAITREPRMARGLIVNVRRSQPRGDNRR